MALALAKSPDRLADYRRKLEDRRRSSPLFDICQFTKALEAAYRVTHGVRLIHAATLVNSSVKLGIRDYRVGFAGTRQRNIANLLSQTTARASSMTS